MVWAHTSFHIHSCTPGCTVVRLELVYMIMIIIVMFSVVLIIVILAISIIVILLFCKSILMLQV